MGEKSRKGTHTAVALSNGWYYNYCIFVIMKSSVWRSLSLYLSLPEASSTRHV
jgi:hypothetical protein